MRLMTQARLACLDTWLACHVPKLGAPFTWEVVMLRLRLLGLVLD